MEKKLNKKIPNKLKPTFKKQKDKVIKEIGGPKGPEPTRYGDWEVKGRVSDF
jgi:hypothetical protein|tara:strand:+ start:497 stop:652 length:156 start_codon:yes stop_codon:yes gene_type:complete